MATAVAAVAVQGAPLAAWAAEQACPPGAVPPAGFTDTAADAHRASIDCVAWWEIARGTTATTFAPAEHVRRDQMASFVARTVDKATPLPQAGNQGFTDIDGNVHAAAINALAAAAVVHGTTATTYAPADEVRRDQMASFLVRGWRHATGESLTPLGAGPFDDIAGNPHAANIVVAHQKGWTQGRGDGTYAPADPVTRGQMASFLARFLGSLVEEGHVSPQDREQPVDPGEPAGPALTEFTIVDADGDGVLSEGDQVVLGFAQPVVAHSSVSLEDDDGDATTLDTDAPDADGDGDGVTAASVDGSGTDTLTFTVDEDPDVDGDGDLDGTITITGADGITSLDGVPWDPTAQDDLPQSDDLAPDDDTPEPEPSPTPSPTPPAGGVDGGTPPPSPPAAPDAQEATAVTTTGFTANWTAVSGATGYRLDVTTTTDFTSFVSGFQNRTVTSTSEAVSGLAAGTTYRYRVRAVSAAGTSPNSNTIVVTTAALPGPATTVELTPDDTNAPVDLPHTVTATVTDADSQPVADGTKVRFEVYEAVDGARVHAGTVVGTSGGQATFNVTFTDIGGRSEGTDVVVACAVPDGATPCIEDDELDGDPITDDPRNIITHPSDFTRIDWKIRRAEALEIDDDARDQVGLGSGTHELSFPVLVLDQFDDPVQDFDVRFEAPGTTMMDITDADGRVTFSYVGPPVSGDPVVHDIAVCQATGESCDDTSPLFDETTATWVEVTHDTVTFPLSWMNEVGAGPAFGNVSDLAAREDAAGVASLTWNTDEGLVCWAVEYTGPSQATAAHVHSGAFDANGPIVIGLGAPELSSDPAHGPPFTYGFDGCDEGHEDGLQAIDAALAAASAGELIDYYVNVHTTDNPAGEIRGQLGLDRTDGGQADLPPIFRMADAAPVQPDPDQRLDLTFATPVKNRDLDPLVAGDFAVTVNDAAVGVLNSFAAVPWDTLALTHPIFINQTLSDGDEVEVSITAGGASKVVDAGNTDLTQSVLTRGFTAGALVTGIAITNATPGPSGDAVVAGSHVRFQNSSGDPQDPRVLVTDQFGHPMEGVEVAATVVSGPPGGSLHPAAQVTAVTGADGVATFSTASARLELRLAGSGYELQFCADGRCATSTPFEVVPAPVNRLFINPDDDLDADDQPQTIVTAGQPIRDRNGDDLTVTAEDEFGNRIEDLGIRARAVDGPGSLVTDTIIATNFDGVATFPGSGLVIQAAGDYRLRYEALGSNPMVQVHSAGLTVVPDEPASLVIANAVPGPADDVVAGTHIQFSNPPEDARILVRDQFDNPVPDVTVVATADPDELEGAPEALTGADGVGVFTDDPGSRLAIPTAAPGYTLTFAVEGSPDPALSATSNPFSVVAAIADAGKSAVTGEQTDVQIIDFEILVADEFENPVTGLSAGDLTAVVTPPGGAPSTPTDLDSAGFSLFAETATPGTYTVRFSPASPDGTWTFTFTAQGVTIEEDLEVEVGSAVATTLELVGDDQPTNTAAGAHIAGSAGDLEVRVLDQFGNLYGPSVTVSAEAIGGPGSIVGSPQATTVDSVATFTSAAASRLEIELAGTYRLRFTASTTDPLETDEFRVLPAAPTTVTLQNQPDETRAGEHVLDGDGDPLVVRVTDEFGNGVPGITVEASATGLGVLEDNDDGEAPNAETSDGAEPDEVGYATFADDGTSTLILRTAGAYTLTFDVPGVDSDTSAPFDVVPNDPTTVLLLDNPVDTQAREHIEGAAGPLAVRVTDEFGNGVNGLTVVASALDADGDPVALEEQSGGPPQAVTGDDATLGSGVALFEDAGTSRLELRIAGLYRLVFDVAGVGSVTSAQFEITAGPAFAGSLVGTPTAGGETTLLISVEDEFGNPISGLVLADFTLRVGDAVGSDCTGVDGPTVVFPDGRFNGFVDNGDGTYTLVFQESPGNYCFDIEVDGTEIVTDQLIVVEDAEVGSITLLNQPRPSVQAGEHITTTTGQSLRVRVRDQFGNPLAGVSVEATAQEGPGTLEDTPQEATTDANGIATFVDLPDSRLVINDPDDYRLRFAVNGVSVTTNVFTVFEPDVTVPTVASPSLAGSDLEADGGGPLVVTVTDGTDPMSGVEVTASLASGPGGGALSGTLTQTTDGAGQATFADLQVNAVGTYELRFTVGTVSEDTAAFDVWSLEEPTVANPSFTDTDLEADGGGPLTVTVTTAAGTPPADGTLVSVGLVPLDIDSTAVLSGTLSQPTTAGEAVFDDLQIDQVGEYALEFSVDVVSGSRTTDTFEVWEVTVPDVADGAPNTALQADPGGGPLVVTVLDADGAPVEGEPVSVDLEPFPGSGAGTLSGTGVTGSVPTDPAGEAEFADLEIDQDGNYQLRFVVRGRGFRTNQFTLT